MNFNLIVIGPDGAGKTTLCKQIAKELDMKYVKNDYREPHKLSKAHDYARYSNHTIFDRFFYPDDMVYRQVKKLPLSKEDIYNWNELEPILMDSRFGIVYVTASLRTLISRLKERGDEYITTDDLESIKRHYDAFLNATSIPLLKLNESDIPLDRLPKKLFTFIKEMSRFYDKRNIMLNYEWDDFKRGL
jgi:thymidylate kinase